MFTPEMMAPSSLRTPRVPYKMDVCEIKFSRNEIGSAVIPEIRAKIEALHRPRGMSCRPATGNIVETLVIF
jgi:hypothetical protein